MSSDLESSLGSNPSLGSNLLWGPGQMTLPSGPLVPPEKESIVLTCKGG